MRKTLYIFILFCTFHFANGQVTEKVYFTRGHNYSTVYSYFVTEFILFSDSTFVENSYRLPNKKEWKNYKNYEPKKREGQISRNGKFYTLTELIDGVKSEKLRYGKITNLKLSFYIKDKGTFKKIYSMRRKS